MNRFLFILSCAVLSVSTFSLPAHGDEKSEARLNAEIAQYPVEGMIRSAIGVTRSGTPIPCFITGDDLDPESEKIRILLVGGLDGNIESTRAVMEALRSYKPLPGKDDDIAISVVPCARPDDIGKKDFVPYSFPPRGNAYNQPENDVAHYLWRWTGMHAPDVVVVMWRTGSSMLEDPGSSEPEDRVPLLPGVPPNKAAVAAGLYLERDGPFFGGTSNLKSTELTIDDLIKLAGNSRQQNELKFPFTTAVEGSQIGFEFDPCRIGGIDAYRFRVGMGDDGKKIWEALASRLEHSEISNARREIQRRVARSPIEVADELAEIYGHKLDSVMYIPALAIVGRMRLGELTDDPSHLRDTEKLAAPFRSGDKESMPPKGNGSTLSGHLVFSELARRTGDESWTAMAQKAADYGFDENGKPKESMPFHSEMSDSVFMGCTILAETGALTGDSKYFEQCLRHLRFMQKLCLRDDGIYRHSPLDEAAWGRGNGFPALGMALSLSALPEKSEEHAAFLESYRAHLTALRKHQDPTGAWHQVIDHEESYREFTSTCMITFAMVRGIRRGWLDESEWAPLVEKSWSAIKSRIGPDGHLVDVCTGTGKQKSLRDYFDRTAILGRDDRGGTMALLVSTEIAFWEREKGN